MKLSSFIVFGRGSENGCRGKSFRKVILQPCFVFFFTGSLLVGWGGRLISAEIPLAENTVISEKVERDWQQQEKNAGRIPGSEDSLLALIETARRMEKAWNLSPETTSKESSPVVTEFYRALRCAETSLKEKPIDKTPPDPHFSDSLFFQSILLPNMPPEKTFPRIVCTRGGVYDFRSVYPFENGDVYMNTLKCFTGIPVTFQLEGLKKDGSYRLRIVFTSDWDRVQKVFINGVEKETVKIPEKTAVERFYSLDGLTEATVEIRHTYGPNVTLAEVNLLADEAPEEAKWAELQTRLPLSYRKQSLKWYSEWLTLRHAMRKILLARPELDFDEILFVKRHWPQGNHQCGHRVGENQTAGADLMILRGLSPDGTVRGLLPPELAAKCGIGRPDLSPDATRIVFPLATPRPIPTPYPWGAGHAHYDPKNPKDSTFYRGGACFMYDLFEIGIDGSGLRNLTPNTPDSEDSEPCWLPDGRILFTSTRGGRFVQCGDWSPVFGLHVMNADGSDVHAITQPQDTEFYPAMLDDGRILFTRWDYVMKPYNVIQELWAVNPDGTRSQKVYGDWYRFSRGPIAMQEARQIPGTRQLVAVGCAHHNSGVGPLLVVNMSLYRGGAEGMKLLTPEIPYPEIHGLQDERKDPNYNDLDQAPPQAGWFTSPWPLSEELFLCVYSPMANNLNDTYGIYLLTNFGFKELVYRLDDASCYSPIPLKPRPKPPVVAGHERLPAGTPAYLVLQDVYQGLEGIPRGTVKWLRVCETYPKYRHTNPHRVDVGVSSGWDMRGVLGYVPVAEDGSASLELPSDRMIFLSALDENFLEVQRMRNYVTLRPGEVQGCIGCHENPLDASPVTRFTSGPRKPDAIQPPAYGAGPMQFERVIQPILNEKCLACHDGSTPDISNRPDFRGGNRVVAGTIGDPDEGPQHKVTTSFVALLPHVSYYQLTGYRGFKVFQSPRAVGSSASPLMKRLKETPCGESLTQEQWRAFSDWIDCNAPYYGTYDDAFLE